MTPTPATRIALIGCGAIATALLELIQHDERLQIAAIVTSLAGTARATAVAQALAPTAAVMQAVPTENIDLVIEAASHSAIAQHVLPALARGVPCVVASVGALAAAGLPEQLEAAARQGGTQLQLIAGAIGGIDALSAAAVGGLTHVRYTGRKPPLAWKGTPADAAHDLGALREATVIFEGSAREAATLYPKNANVAATVSFAGLGLDATRVRLIADPSVSDNMHELEAEGAFGSFELRMRNKPLPINPKSSALTVYSAVRALRNRVAGLVL